MNLPRFLIIGAMKAGTTTLYRDLLPNPQVFMPQDKEPNNLTTDEVLTDDGLRTYAELFRPMGPDQIGGEASTGYTKIPDFSGVPERAMRVLGKDLKLIYLVREPVSRAISHHSHALTFDTSEPDVNKDVRTRAKFLDYSRYAMQAEAWLRVYPAESLMLLRFESFVKDRKATVERVSRFIGVEPRVDLVKEDVTYNKGTERVRNAGPLAVFTRSGIYRRTIRPLLSPEIRTRVRRLVMPRPAVKQIPPTRDTIEWMLEQLAPDTRRFESMIGSAIPEWDPARVLAKYTTDKRPLAPSGEGN